MPVLTYLIMTLLFFIQAMVHPNPLSRPSAARLANLQTLRGTNSSNVKSRSQLYLELKETKNKLRLLEQQLSASGRNGSKLVGKGQARSKSSNNVVSDPKWWTCNDLIQCTVAGAARGKMSSTNEQPDGKKVSYCV